IVAYEWLCGSRPFGGDAVELAMHHASSPPPRLRSKNSSVSQAVEEVVLKALAKDPHQRYPTVQAFAEALEQASRAPKRLLATRKLSAIAPSPAKRESPAFHNLAQRAAKGPDQEYASRPAWELERQLQAAIVSSMKRNRLPMIQKVRTYWVHGVLKQSLHGASFLSVGLDERPDVIASPWSARLSQSVTVHQSKHQPQSLTPATSITEIYDQAGGEVLILGEPGSGKTTLLLELTRHLLDRAEHNELAPIPVVFLLASWAEKRLPIDQWLVEELHHKYQVPRLLAEAWVRKEMLLPLLDGLDEVAANVRSACVVAINTYKQERGLSPLVVSSRLRDYLLFPPRVLLHSAVVLRPLTMPQIEGYLRSSGAKFEIIFQMLSEDPMVQRLVTTPLMLHIITLAYQNTSPEDLLKIYASLERYQGILSTYVEQMLQHHATSTAYQPQQMVGWLTRLARHAQRYGHGQSVFYIEQIQPEWINTGIWMQVYRGFAVLLPGTLIGALTGLLGNVLLFHAGSIGSVYVDTVYGMVMGYLLSGRQTQHSASGALPGSPAKPEKPLFKGSPLQTAFVVGLITFLCLGASKDWTSGLANGLILGILSVPLYLFFQRCKRASMPGATSPGKRPFPLQHLTNGILVGLACGLTSVITLLVTPQPGTTLTYLLVLDLRDSLRNALLGTLLSLVLASNDGIIRPAEIVSWSWKRFWQSMGGLRNVVQDILIGLVIAVIFASKQLFQENMNNVFGAGASTGLLVALGMHLVYAIFQGVSSANLDNRRRSRPNEGIRRSLRYSLLWGIIGMCIATILSIVTTVINAVLSDGLASLQNRNALLANLHLGLANALLLGPGGGLLVGLLLGGLACLQHGVLRLILSMTKVLPL
ncbi:MAG TPA: NACHT domain-containing protein, partial [Ktedonobacteraceae bacterium]|nr:NACHT domain-containing protein [Ktedonobacteraceae bacterium]